jgi:lipoprotein-anchoring transpeptidase ErfK/SrfK
MPRSFASLIAVVAGVLLFASANANAFTLFSRDVQMRDPETGEIVTGRGGLRSSPVAREIVPYTGKHSAGTVVVSTDERRLYLVLPGGKALRYGIGVGRDGFQWGGVKSVTMKREWPDWTPPAAMLKRRPELPRWMPGGPQNPLGARALYLGSSIYRIHGSNEPQTIGQAVSSGCFRMTNDDVVDLYDRVRVGTRVVILR